MYYTTLYKFHHRYSVMLYAQCSTPGNYSTVLTRAWSMDKKDGNLSNSDINMIDKLNTKHIYSSNLY